MLAGFALLAAMSAGGVMFDDYCVSFNSFFPPNKQGLFSNIKSSFDMIDHCVENPSSDFGFFDTFKPINDQYNAMVDYKQAVLNSPSYVAL